MIITWQWCIVTSRAGILRFAKGETPSGTAYDISATGCPVRSDDLEYVLNKEAPSCPHSSEMVKPVKKGLAPKGVVLPEPIIIEVKVIKTPEVKVEVNELSDSKDVERKPKRRTKPRDKN